MALLKIELKNHCYVGVEDDNKDDNNTIYKMIPIFEKFQSPVNAQCKYIPKCLNEMESNFRSFW